jgi:hypothetical protein
MLVNTIPVGELVTDAGDNVEPGRAVLTVHGPVEPIPTLNDVALVMLSAALLALGWGAMRGRGSCLPWPKRTGRQGR